MNHGVLIGGEGDCYFLEQLPKKIQGAFWISLKMMKLIFAISISAVPDEHNFFFLTTNYISHLTLGNCIKWSYNDPLQLEVLFIVWIYIEMQWN